MYKINRLLTVATAIVIIYTLVNLTVIEFNISEKTKTIEQLEKEKVQKEHTVEELIDIMTEGATIDSITKVAQDKLGLALPGERVMVDVGSK